MAIASYDTTLIINKELRLLLKLCVVCVVRVRIQQKLECKTLYRMVLLSIFVVCEKIYSLDFKNTVLLNHIFYHKDFNDCP